MTHKYSLDDLGNIITFKSVENQTTQDYFDNNKFAVDAFNEKYTAFKGETYIQAVKRVCDYISSAEDTEEKQQYWSARWFDEIYNDWWHPAGSIMQGANSGKKISLANCVTISMGSEYDTDLEWDNLESIFKNGGYTIAKCAAYRQGLGVGLSRLRANKMKVLNSANESTGSLHWGKFFDSIGYLVGQKGRIPAMLFYLSIKHPDIEQFVKIKSDYTQIQNANISVQITDDFYDITFENENKIIIELKNGEKLELDKNEQIEIDGKTMRAIDYAEIFTR